jgi:hypothetical protein
VHGAYFSEVETQCCIHSPYSEITLQLLLTFENILRSWTQELLRVGAHCWVLHPKYGRKPVAEGIAGGAPVIPNSQGGLCRNLLLELCEGDKQVVTVTKMLRKNTELMFPDVIPCTLFLDNFLTPPAPSGTHVTWLSRYLRDKAEVT